MPPVTSAHQNVFRLTLCVFSLPLFCGSIFGQDLSRDDRDLFEIHVRPTLVTHCIRCHGDEKQEGDLALTSLAALIQGGESGPTIVAGKPNESLILEALRHESLEMPPDEQLDTELIDGIAKWIAAGAPWPEDVVLKSLQKLSDEDRQWWCYQPIKDPQPPAHTDSEWCRSEIDQFVLEKLSEKDLTPAHEADPVTLARRVHFAITGLPPDDATI